MVTFTQKNYMGWNPSDGEKLFVTLDKIGQIPGIDAKKPILFGYSAGGQMALELFMKDASRLGGMVLDAAYPIMVRARRQGIALELERGPVNPAVKNVPVLALVGEVDPGAGSWQAVKASWKKAGVPLEIITVPDKRHQWLFDAPRTERLEQWLSHVAAGKLPGRDGAAPSGTATFTGKQEAPPAQPTEKQRGVLGVRLDDHAVVETVAPGFGADKAGLQPGDAIVAIDGQPIKQTAGLGGDRRTKSAGDKVRVTFIRDGREQTVEVTLFGPASSNKPPNAPNKFAQRVPRPCKTRTTRGPAS